MSVERGLYLQAATAASGLRQPHASTEKLNIDLVAELYSCLERTPTSYSSLASFSNRRT